jgi:hypothetical protein
MKVRIKGWQFLENIHSNPNWASTLPANTEVIVEEFIILENSKIKKIGPNFIFEGINPKDGTCAEFKNCPNLTTVEATFTLPVKFINCGLETTKGIIMDSESCKGFKRVAQFKDCLNLTLAEGTWPGPVDYGGSSIKKVENLIILHANSEGEAAFFENCKDLEELSGTFPGSIFAPQCIKLKSTKNLIVKEANKNGTAAVFRNCTNLTDACGTYNGFVDYKGCPVKLVSPEYLKILSTNKEGVLASFWGCPSIELATGSWDGALDFSHSNIKSTRGLEILKSNHKGIAALFCSAQGLDIGEGTYHGTVDYSNSSIAKTGYLKIIPSPNLKTYANFENCGRLSNLPPNIPPQYLKGPKELLKKAVKLNHLRETFQNLKNENDQGILEI